MDEINVEKKEEVKELNTSLDKEDLLRQAREKELLEISKKEQDNNRLSFLYEIDKIKNEFKGVSSVAQKQIDVLIEKEKDPAQLLTDLKRVILKEEFLPKVSLDTLPKHRQAQASLKTQADVDNFWGYMKDEEDRQMHIAKQSEAQNNAKNFTQQLFELYGSKNNILKA